MARRTQRRIIRLVALILIIAALLSLRFWEELGPDQPTPTGRWTVTAVIDGDTVKLLGGDRLRLLSIDCPERSQPLYNRATRLVESVVLGKPARIEFAGARRDKYGRLLGYLYVDDTLFVNKMLLDSGLAGLYLFRDTELNTPESKLLLAAQRSAIERSVGIWTLDHSTEEYYLSTVSSFRFHRPGCRHIVDSPPDRLVKYDSRLDAAREGLSPCRTCQP